MTIGKTHPLLVPSISSASDWISLSDKIFKKKNQNQFELSNLKCVLGVGAWSGQTLTDEIIFWNDEKDILSLFEQRNRNNENLKIKLACFIAFWNVIFKWVAAVLLCFALFWSERCSVSIGTLSWQCSLSLLRLFPFLGILAFLNSLRFISGYPIGNVLRCSFPPAPICGSRIDYFSFLWFFQVVVRVSIRRYRYISKRNCW